jgi:hypothetical protein
VDSELYGFYGLSFEDDTVEGLSPNKILLISVNV